ncbi:MAG: class I tRNA ligase family protein [Thermoplasmatota archaeon]
MKDPIKLFNSMGRSKMDFRPGKGREVRIFTCGPSIYARPHIGNFRTFLFQDVLVRYLDFKGYRVIRAMNLTDVEDKAIMMADTEGLTLSELTERNERRLWEEWDALGLKWPDKVPRSSRSVSRSVKLIKMLLKNGIAYKDGKDVFYDPTRFDGFGRLFGLDMLKWPKRPRKFRKDTYPGVQWNMGDFILWHGCGEEDRVCWDEDLGSGRPSWNVQDPAMCWESLGTGIDIWCGGWDNLWRHHDYNIAVMEGAFGKELAPYWLHGGHLLLDGRKMSKSKGNILYTEDLIEKGYSMKEVRFYLLYGNYRDQRNLTMKGLKETVERLRSAVRSLESIGKFDGGRTSCDAKDQIERIVPDILERMDDDLDLKGAFDGLQGKLMRLSECSMSGELSKIDAKMVLSIVAGIDRFWGFLTPGNQ